ncbi:MAG: gamma-glutamyl-gamma-aminobutyrate hydrolase family protein [Ilumatobacteraceae bacterium]
MVARILLPGKLTTNAVGVRGDSYSNGLKYSEAVARAGGVVTTIAPLPQHLRNVAALVESSSGVLIQGGGDIDPARYGESKRSDTIYGIVEAHDDFELAVLKEAVRQDKPILAICRGIQLLNVALGGTLHQDLGDVLSDRESHWDTYHPISLVDASRVARAMGSLSPERSHSYHHQAIKNLAPDLTVVGSAPDGVIEAVEHRSCKWVVGVQWHPEDDVKDSRDQQRLFDAFVANC